MQESNRFKLIVSLVIANLIRLLKIIPNNDPVMSMALPFSRRSPAITSFLFPLITMASFDLVTNELGPWTVVTSLTYGFLGLAFHYLLKERKKVEIGTYLGFGVVGVLVFDFVTGVVATPFLFPPMTFEQALIGQIPFTLLHLITSSAFIVAVTPLLDKEVLANKQLSDSRVAMLFSKLTLQ